MNLLLMWISTIIISKGMNYITIGRMFKDIYGNGYKINFKKFIEMSNSFNDNKSKIRQYIMFLNIYDSINMGMNYLKDPNAVINFFFMNDSLDEMNKKEKELYEEKPSLIRAMYISELSELSDEKKIRDNLEFKDIIKINYKDKGRTSFILEFYDSNNKIIVDRINIKTDVMSNMNDNSYGSFIVSKLKFIKKIVNHPIKKERLVKYLRRLNRKDNIEIIEERINVKDENKKLNNNSKLVKHSDLTMSDVAFDKTYDVREYIDSVIDRKPMTLEMKRRNNNE